MKRIAYLHIIVALTGWSLTLPAQNLTELQDSIPASRLVADWSGARETGTRVIGAKVLSTMVSATGEADAIKFIQTLPGVSTGAEGSSAIYVRGGNIGSNLITLDGVPLYGSSHLLGFTSVYSPEMVSETRFQVGGFTSEEGNLTASHIKLTSAIPDFQSWKGTASASNFLLGGSVSAPLVKNRLAIVASLRVSPIGAEYALFKGLLPSGGQAISDVSAFVYDLYAKAVWRMTPRQQLSFSVFRSLDTYRYLYGTDSDEHMRWDNFVALVNHSAQWRQWSFNTSLSYNRFTSRQGQIKTMGDTYNNLAIGSGINEGTLQGMASRPLGRYGMFQAGLKSRLTRFNPGSSMRISGGLLMPQESPESGDVFLSSIHTAHAQFSYMNEGVLELRAAGRANVYIADAERDGVWRTRFDPEASFLARWYPVKWLGLEATADWLTQYYHTLEGVPLGWSLDMIIPSDLQCLPEKSRQFYVGLLFSFGKHRLSVGGYDKKMDYLVYFTDATQLFSSAMAGWKQNIDVGEGTSRGLEFLYELGGERLSARLAYTLSKTDRMFPKMNEGKAFPAKFDRTHILNANASYTLVKKENREIGLNTSFTFQSGHWETVAAGSFYGYLLMDDTPVEVDWFTTTHNYRMPNYIRWDMGAFLKWIRSSHTSTLNVGVYNLLNRHNPFTVTYDPDTREWKQISLLPIMPSLNYRISF